MSDTALLSAIHIPADYVSLRILRRVFKRLRVRNGHVEDLATEHITGAMIHAIWQGSVGYAATSNITPASLQAAAKSALEIAKSSKPYSLVSVDPSQIPVSQGQYDTPILLSWNQKSTAESVALLKDLCVRLKVSPDIATTSAELWHAETTQTFCNTAGSNVRQTLHTVSFDMQATASVAGETQTRTYGGHRGNCQQRGAEFLDLYNLRDEAARIGNEALMLVHAEECPTATTDVLLYPDQMMLQIHESIGHPLELDRILGDERNYAGSSFVKLSDIGTLRYGSPLLNVTFDPEIPHEFASYGYDDEGLAAKRSYIIKDGLLVNALGGYLSQSRSGIPGVANARATSWNRPPIDRMANLNVEAGNASLESMIASIERGILMKANRSWSIDDRREKFQFGCEWAQRIENGKLGAVLRNPNYRGVTIPFWHNLKAVGNAASLGYYGTPYCGKGEPQQAITVGHGSPVCHFSNVDVFGGAA